MRRLFIHGTLIACDAEFSVYRDASLAIDGKDIVYVGEGLLSDFEADEIIDCTGWILMPGFVNAHVHLGEHIFKGWMDETAFEGLFYSTLFRWEAGLEVTDVFSASRAAAAEAAKCGVTTVADMYHHAEASAQAISEIGIRALIGQKILGFSLNNPPRMSGPVIDYQFDDNAFADQLQSAEQFASQWNGLAEGRITTALSPHATNTLTASMLREVGQRALSLGLPVHMHLAQMSSEQQTVLERDGLGCVELLDQCGLLEGRFLGAHGIFVSPKEMPLLSQPTATIIHNPIANAKDAGLIAPIDAYQHADVQIALGTDAFRMNLLEAARFAAYIQRTTLEDGTAFPAHTVLGWATLGGARALGLDHRTGSLETGKAADFIAMDMEQIEGLSTGDPHVQVLNYGSRDLIRRVYVDGRLICLDEQLQTAREEEIRQQFREHMHAVSIREGRSIA